MIELIIKLNPDIQVRVSGDDQESVIAQAAFWGTLPAVCPLCGARVHLQHRHPKGYDYYGLECEGEIPHECNFGQRKDGTGLYYKNGWRERPIGGDEYDEAPPQRFGGRGSPPPEPRGQEQPRGTDPMICSSCRTPIRPSESSSSMKHYGRPMCAGCMNRASTYAREGRPAGAGVGH